ncbi:D-Ala-D-Ala carboxypeptidase family metallohydrolase [Pseudomonas sp. 148P]|uniref:D-Ala-D-Ala carboxypeptidase family metallohydrolase n=1 Tax=Pseudomonas ulcerans TaxID=3115852 RepID=A0ABU7HQF6_9PSED|nr:MULTISPECIES: D-Ala-D-Ala carboxypeptidase family metallohydrolase [unclassified Pseudomonas]MEE1923705.1 D-Ala-D-Ala carboxypeptidase family metallohydrolase [Pseudomonas sp. 147P]MEE1933765.1 D-Ala-D-Ala carboxypeptidase family metallohydrolase [Pseudomonas sp. 148P]
MFLTPHFTLAEMTTSQIANREGLDNNPDSKTIANLVELCKTLEQVRSLVGQPLLVSSGYRSVALNRRVGGSATSAHLLGLAADIIAVSLTPRELAERIRDSSLAFDQLILEFDGWVHLGLAEHQQRRQVLTIRQGTGYLPGLQ